MTSSNPFKRTFSNSSNVSNLTSPSSLNSFLVYNTEFGTTETTQHKNIVFYHPENVSLDEKTNNIGLCEAFVQFTSSFGPSKLCETVRTERYKQVFLNPEENFWVVMAVNSPSCKIHAGMQNQQQGRDSTKIKSPTQSSGEGTGGSSHDDSDLLYFPNHLKDSVLHSVLNQAYVAFRLFNGTFSYILETYGVRILKHRLDLFFKQYLNTIDFQNLDLLCSLDGIQFLPLDRNTYLSIQCFINMTEERFKFIKYSAFLFNDYLVTSGLEQEDIRPLYRCLKKRVFGWWCVSHHTGEEGIGRKSCQ